MFPEAITVVVAQPWMWGSPAYPGEEAAILRACEKRKSEFRAGRHCARSALHTLGAGYCAVPKGEHREPLWPSGYVGSISHTNNHCSALVARAGLVSAIGHDVELNTALPPGILERICSLEERQHIQESPDYPVPLGKLYFSAKESVYKTYFPLNAHKLGFEDVDIEFDLERQTWVATIKNPAPLPIMPVAVLHGNFRYDSLYVYTGSYL